LLPRALLDAGLAARLGAEAVSEPIVPDNPYDPVRDPDTGILNAAGIARFARKLAEEVGGLLDADRVPVMFGGDCSILLGSLLALRRRGRYGLLFLDAHNDCYDPAIYRPGEAAAMDLALALGIGPELLTRYDGIWPLALPEDTVLLGTRDQITGPSRGRRPTPECVLEIGLGRIREEGIGAAWGRAAERLVRPDLGGFWLHLDADVLDDAAMPAVDYRIPGGLGWAELEEVLAQTAASGRLAGVDITIYNPCLDLEGCAGRALADTLARGLKRSF
jgi:arginase